MSDNIAIAKNTFYLYIRMFFTMAVSLYTSRVVLITLGVEDYGIYIIVAGVVTLFGFFNAAMASATQRFLSFEIGKKNEDKLKKTFNSALNIHIGIAVLILFLAETVGLWFVNYKLNVPTSKLNIINWVYQLSVFTFLIGVVQVPYNALIIARERMNIYAVFSIIEVILKLLILYLLVISPFEKLKTYAFLVFAVTLLITSFYKYYCKYNFKESQYHFFYEKELYLKILSFTGWSLFGNVAVVAKGQGNNILLNLFFGTVLNAAYGITLQVQSAVSLFVSNFQMAVNPQIIKNYASENKSVYLNLIFKSSKISFFLVFLLVYPLIFNIEYLLELWLVEPPKYTSIFITLALINILIDSISGPLMTGIQSTGNIKWYQIITGSLLFLNLPIAFLFLKYDMGPEYIFYVSIVISVLALFFRLYFIHLSVKFPIIDFIKAVLLKNVFVISIVLLIIQPFKKLSYNINDFIFFIISSLIISILSIFCIGLIGLNRSERTFIKQLIFKKNKNGRV